MISGRHGGCANLVNCVDIEATACGLYERLCQLCHCSFVGDGDGGCVMRETKDSAKTPTPAVSDALLHIVQAGHLLSLVSDRAQRVQLMKAMTDQGLAVWNKAAAKYELTAFGQRCLARSRQNSGDEALKAS